MSEANIVLPALSGSEWMILWAVLGSAVVALLYGLFMVWKVLRCDPGLMSMRKVAKAIDQLNKHCNFVKVLGSYPDAE